MENKLKLVLKLIEIETDLRESGEQELYERLVDFREELESKYNFKLIA